MHHVTRSTPTLTDTQCLAARFAELLPRRVVLTFAGPLGSGKTTFIQALLASRGIGQVSSPTYVYHQRYGSPDQAIDHFDLYRVHHDPALLARTGIHDYAQSVPGWLVIEWPLSELSFDPDVPHVQIEATGAPEFRYQFLTADPMLGENLEAHL